MDPWVVCRGGDANTSCTSTEVCCRNVDQSVLTAYNNSWCCPDSSNCGAVFYSCAARTPAAPSGTSDATVIVGAVLGVIGGILIISFLVFAILRHRRRSGSDSFGQVFVKCDDQRSLVLAAGDTRPRMDKVVDVVLSRAVRKEREKVPTRSPYHHDHQIYVQHHS